jgi:hypothetical protein
MTKIAHYEVYIDGGSGWQLLERFAVEQRQEAYSRAKEEERNHCKVKIIKEIFEIEDNSYTETVEYVSNLNSKKGTKKTLGKIDYQQDSNEVVQDIVDSRRNIYKALLKFVALIIVSLIFANIFVGLVFPLLDVVISEEHSRSAMFVLFFVVFLALAIPLVLKNIPWYIFMSQDDTDKKEIVEEKFFDKAQSLVKAYNINSDIKNLQTSAYPEAPIEYKQYLIYFLSEILSNLNVRSALQNSFSRLGVKFLVFGGCLELSRYGGLTMSEANSILFDAFKIVDGDKADLEEFYETKQTYNDNKLAIYLTGVGAFLMNQVINDQKLYIKALNQAFDRWEKQHQQTSGGTSEHESKNDATPAMKAKSQAMGCRVNIKSDLKFLDSGMPHQEDIANATSTTIRAMIANLVEKYQGTNVIENAGMTQIDFAKMRDAAKFAVEYLKDISTYSEENGDERMILRNCCVLLNQTEENESRPDAYVTDIFEHVYNGEIVAVKEVATILEADGYEVEFLGDKSLKESHTSAELYKIKY